MWDWLGRRKVLLGKPGFTHLPPPYVTPPNTVGGPPNLREGFRIKRRSRTVADGVAGTTPAYGHGLRLLWYQARVAPFTVDTRPLYPHSSRTPPGSTCCSSFAERVATRPTPRSDRGGGSFPARLHRGLPPAWGLGTRAHRTVRGHSIQTDLFPYPKTAPPPLWGTLTWSAFWPLRLCFDVGAKP